MKLFLVLPQDEYGERVKELIKEHFGNRHIALDDRQSQSWVVAAPNDKTPANVAESLCISGKESTTPNPGVVVQIHEYYGYDSSALWQQMDVWANG